jgi:predicted DNA-binding protein
MISKTKESGRADLLIRTQPELKERLEKAARLVGMTKTDWVVQAIEAILHVQELQAEAQKEILAIRHQQEAKFEEIVAALAAEQKLGDLASLTTKNRTRFEATADKKLENWRSERRTLREDGAELRLVRRACSRLHLDQIRPHGLVVFSPQALLRCARQTVALLSLQREIAALASGDFICGWAARGPPQSSNQDNLSSAGAAAGASRQRQRSGTLTSPRQLWSSGPISTG